MFWTRLASGIVLVAITIALMVNGGWPLFWVVTAISLIGLFELLSCSRTSKTPSCRDWIYIQCDSGYSHIRRIL